MPKMKQCDALASRYLSLEPGDYYERPSVSGGGIRRCVINKTPFIAGKSSARGGSPSVYGRWEWGIDRELPRKAGEPWPEKPIRYVVYSYGNHFPMFIWDDEVKQWYGNKDKYSRTTSNHQHAANPTFFTEQVPNRAIQWIDTDRMISIARYGVFATVCHAAGGNAFALDEGE